MLSAFVKGAPSDGELCQVGTTGDLQLCLEVKFVSGGWWKCVVPPPKYRQIKKMAIGFISWKISRAFCPIEGSSSAFLERWLKTTQRDLWISNSGLLLDHVLNTGSNLMNAISWTWRLKKCYRLFLIFGNNLLGIHVYLAAHEIHI